VLVIARRRPHRANHRQQHDALVLHDARERDQKAVNGQQRKRNQRRHLQAVSGQPAVFCQPPPDAGKQGQRRQPGQRERQSRRRFIQPARQRIHPRRQQHLHRPLLVQEQDAVVPGNHAGGQHHRPTLVALKLAVVQVDQPQGGGQKEQGQSKPSGDWKPASE
jgi:hypothetical protein